MIRRVIAALLLALLAAGAATAQMPADQSEQKLRPEPSEFSFIGYFLVRNELSNVYPTNEFLKGQVVGRFFGGNTTNTGAGRSRFTEQRFLPMITYTPRLFDGWAKVRMSFELDWTWGDANYGAGGNFGGAFGADFVNLQTQNLFLEFNPNRQWYINVGLHRLYDNIRVPWYTPTDLLLQQGFRLAFWGSDATGAIAHWFPTADSRWKAGAWQLYENNVEQDDDVQLFELQYERDLSIKTTAGLAFWYCRDTASGEGGVSILGQGLNSGLSNYNGVFNFNFGSERHTADIFWAGLQFHTDPLLQQGRFGYSGFVMHNFGEARTATRAVDISGWAANLRTAWRYGRAPRDQMTLEGVFTTGDSNNIDDGVYNGVLTGNNWTSPGAVFIGHGLHLLLPHGTVVNRWNAAVVDLQNIGYGLTAGIATVKRELIPNKLRVESALGAGWATKVPAGVDNFIGWEANAGVVWTPKVFLDFELRLAHLWLGGFYDWTVVNGNRAERPLDPWTVFASVKWIMF
jgi:hypothetical protein